MKLDPKIARAAKIRRRLTSIDKEVKKLVEAMRKEWSEIKDFVHSWEATEAATKRIHNMKLETKRLNTEKRKLTEELSTLNVPEDGSTRLFG